MSAIKSFCCALFLTISSAPLYSQSPEVAPGVTLPAASVSVVDQDSKGTVQALPLHSAVVASDPHTGSNVAKGLIYANQHNTVQLAGKTSATMLQSATPSFYVRLPDDQRQLMRAQVALLRLKPTDQTRIVLEFTANSFGGHRKRKIDEVAVEKKDIQGGDWVKVTPSQPLPPGEYGLMMLPQDPLAYSETVYDVTIAAK